MGFLGKIFATPDGIREVIKQNYVECNPQPIFLQLPPLAVFGKQRLSEHQIRIIGALAIRYLAQTVVGIKPPTMAKLFGECLPFILMKPEVGIDAIAEYVLWKEKPEKANVSFLRVAISQVFKEKDWSDYGFIVVFTIGSHVPWRSLLDQKSANIIEIAASEFSRDLVINKRTEKWASECFYGKELENKKVLPTVEKKKIKTETLASLAINSCFAISAPDEICKLFNDPEIRFDLEYSIFKLALLLPTVLDYDLSRRMPPSFYEKMIDAHTEFEGSLFVGVLEGKAGYAEMANRKLIVDKMYSEIKTEKRTSYEGSDFWTTKKLCEICGNDNFDVHMEVYEDYKNYKDSLFQYFDSHEIS